MSECARRAVRREYGALHLMNHGVSTLNALAGGGPYAGCSRSSTQEYSFQKAPSPRERAASVMWKARSLSVCSAGFEAGLGCR